MEQKRAYKYRIYPTDEQKYILARTFGCVRYVYNWSLRQKTDAYYKEQKRLYYKDLSEMLTSLKDEVPIPSSKRNVTSNPRPIPVTPLSGVMRGSLLLK